MAAETKTTSEVHHEGGGHEAFPPFDPTHFLSQIFWFVIAFAILYALMSRIALPRVGEIKQNAPRQDRRRARRSQKAAGASRCRRCGL